MDNLMLALTNNSGAWEGILNWLFSFIGNIGWCVVILTILIKLILSPFEFMQKKGMKKMTAAMTQMQPEMEKIKAKCGNNQELYNQKMQELYKKHNINPAAGCGPMLLYMVISSVIFITFFNCLRVVAPEQITKQYNELSNVYTTAYTYYKGEEPLEINGVKYKIRADQQTLITNNSDYNLYITEYNNAEANSEIKSTFASATEYATQKRIEALSQQAVVDGIKLYKEANQTEFIELDGFTDIKQSFLWIKNIWRCDHYNSVFPSAEEYISSSNLKFNKTAYTIQESQKDIYKDADGNSLVTESNGVFSVQGYYKTIDGVVITSSEVDGKNAFVTDFNQITKNINKTYDGWNGYFILLIIVAGVTLFGSKLSNIGSKTRDKKGFEVAVKPQRQNVLMMVLLTGLFVWITWSYTAAFALYIATSSLIGIPMSIIMNYIMNSLERKEIQKSEISYSRYKK